MNPTKTANGVVPSGVLPNGQNGGTPQPAPAAPTAKVKAYRSFSWMWLIPLVAAGLVVYLFFTGYAKRGPVVTLTISSATDLQVDQTQVKHKAVPLGTVEEIKLAPDMSRVILRIRMVGTAKPMLTDHARFWVVRPHLSAGNVSGLETLVSGAYIEMDPGLPGGKKQEEFEALEQPPGRQSDEPGHVYVLKAARLGSLSAGAPIYYRDVSVGEVLSYDLGDGLGPVSLRVFVREPYDRFVHPQTRFWNASGLSVTMGAEGMHLELESIQSVLSGGIAFETPPANQNDPPAEDAAMFDLYSDKATADAAFYRENIPYVTYFETSVQGLSRGSSVQLFGVQVGSVSDVKLVFDPDKQQLVARVAFNLQPERILNKNERQAGDVPAALRQAFAETGMRVVLESSNFITGAKDLSIMYTPGKKPSDLLKEGDALVLPSQGGGMDGLTASLSDIANKVDKMPFEEIGQNLNSTLITLQHLAAQIDTQASPALAQLPIIAEQMSQVAQKANGALGPEGYGRNSEFQHNMELMVNHVNEAARSFRALADYLDRHPESLIRGRSGQAGER